MKGGQDFKNKSFEELLVEDLRFSHRYERSVYLLLFVFIVHPSECFLKQLNSLKCVRNLGQAEDSESMTG